MKVLTVAAIYPNPVQPGLGTFSLERVRALSRRAEVRVVAPVPYFPSWALLKGFRRWHAQSTIPAMEQRSDHAVHHPRRLVIPKVGSFTSGYFYAATLRRVLLKTREEFDYDILDVHFAWPDGFGTVLAARGLGVPVCITVHGSDMTLMPGYASIRPQIQHAMRNADRVIAVSSSLSKTALRLGSAPERLRVIPNGVDTKHFFPVDRTAACTQLGLSPDRPRLLSVGSLIPRKGHEHLVDAVARLVYADGMRDLQLVIVGEGESRSALAQLIRHRRLERHVLLAGSIPHDELHTWFGAADLFCLTSSREGWPTVLFESWACGTPVVATAVDGVPEAVASPTFGLLVDRQDGHLIADRVLEAFDRTWDADAMVAYAGRHTWDLLSELIYKEFQAIGRAATIPREQVG